VDVHEATRLALRRALRAVGNTFSRQGRHADALAAYREPVKILLRIAAKDSSDARWQRELAIAKHNVGTALVSLGRSEEARAEFREAEAQMQRAIAMAPDKAKWPQDLEEIRAWLADCEIASSSHAGRDSGDR
jgi:tetratricopeptide (TPR) repeat protein